MTFILSSLEVGPAISNQDLHCLTFGLQLDPSYPGLELDHNVSGLDPVSVYYGPESAPDLNTKVSSLLFCSIFAAMTGS